MKTSLSHDGELEISQNSRQILIFAIVFAVALLVVDGFFARAFLHPELDLGDFGIMERAILWIGNLGLIAFVVWAFWFVPFRRKFVISSKTISIVDRWVFNSRATSYHIAEVDHFGFSYFEQYRSSSLGALIRMHLRSGEEVRLMKLPSISDCKVAHEAMDAYFAASSQQELVYQLPADY